MKDRRQFLSLAARGFAGVAFAPAVIRQDSSRPAIGHGTASGDVTREGAVVWGRTDRPARMLVEWSTTESFQDVRRLRGPETAEVAGYTARVDLQLPPGERIFYRVQFEDLADSRNLSIPATGSLLSAPRLARDVTFAWSADTVGQGWGINSDWGGIRMYETIRRARPDFFIHCGDTIYADAPLPSEMRLPNGTIWKNLVTPAKSKVAETLEEFRGNHLYNLLDDNVRRFNAEIPQLVLWDDHEVKNNWYPGMTLEADDRYTQKDIRVLASHARRAFLEHTPIRLTRGASTQNGRIYRSSSYGPLLDVFALDFRTYRGPNSANRQPVPSAATRHAGAQQLMWLKDTLAASRSTWKVIASDMPIGLLVRDGEKAFEAIANGDGPPLGREHEIADLLRFIRQRKIQNVVWVTGDVHYAAAHHYHPDRASFKDFQPFWEFVAGPLHAGTGRPSELDNTFGPDVRFVGVPRDLDPLAGPAAGLQFFGMVRISATTRVMTVELRNLAGDSIYAVDLEPAGV